MERRTWSPKLDDMNRGKRWYVVDAEGQTLGRIASVIAATLRGKTKPTYTPHADMGDFVVVVNAEKVVLTGKKETQKFYSSHSGYPGGLRRRSVREVRRFSSRAHHRKCGPGHAAPEYPRPASIQEAEGLCRPGSSACDATA